MLNAARTGVVEERMGRAFSTKEHLELNREGEEVSQVKKGDHKEVKRSSGGWDWKNSQDLHMPC